MKGNKQNNGGSYLTYFEVKDYLKNCRKEALFLKNTKYNAIIN